MTDNIHNLTVERDILGESRKEYLIRFNIDEYSRITEEIDDINSKIIQELESLRGEISYDKVGIN